MLRAECAFNTINGLKSAGAQFSGGECFSFLAVKVTSAFGENHVCVNHVLATVANYGAARKPSHAAKSYTLILRK